MAEAYYRAGDFRSAADAYGAALREIPAGVPAGVLMAQGVGSEIKAGRIDEARARLDVHVRDTRLDAVNRWQAEWMLARALQAAGRTPEARTRVEALLGGGEGPDVRKLPAELRARLGWLHVRLALDTEDTEAARTRAQALLGSLDGLEPRLRTEVEASLRLLQAKAAFQMGRTDEAVALLKALRTGPLAQTDAAVYSYIEEADHYARRDNFVDAQAVLIRLADGFKQHAYAPFALYLAALNAERRGQTEYYEQAYRILERINQEYPRSDLVFAARLKQGDLARRLNDFGRAELTYKFLINNFAQHPGVLSAELALGIAHRAQIGPGEVSHFESAVTIFERLQDLPNAAPDLRVEAGFQWGDLLAQPGPGQNLERAKAVWWTLVTTFLLDPARATGLGPGGRYWLARALLRYGDVSVQQGNLEEARNAYAQIEAHGLPFVTLARASLVRAGGRPAGGTP